MIGDFLLTALLFGVISKGSEVLSESKALSNKNLALVEKQGSKNLLDYIWHDNKGRTRLISNDHLAMVTTFYPTLHHGCGLDLEDDRCVVDLQTNQVVVNFTLMERIEKFPEEERKRKEKEANKLFKIWNNDESLLRYIRSFEAAMDVTNEYLVSKGVVKMSEGLIKEIKDKTKVEGNVFNMTFYNKDGESFDVHFKLMPEWF